MDTPWTGLTPRKYQEEIFTQSLESNVIAALGTGGGKTLISALLIKSTALKNVSRSKVIIFLVPKVALVEQQAAFLSSNTPLKVAKLHGQIVDVTDHSEWESRFKEHDVFVMTGEQYRLCYRKDPKRNLDAKVVDVRQHSAELELHLPRPSEIIEVYAPPATEEHDSHLHRALGAFASFFSRNDDDFDWAKTERRYKAALYDLGVYCAELYLFREVDSRVSLLVAQAMPLLPDASGVDEEIITVPGLASRFKAPSPELAHIADILDDHRDFFLEDTSQHISLDRCTPKVGKLISILMDYEASTRTLRTPSSGSAMPNLAPFQTIIFVEQRHTASCLAHLLPRIAELGGKFESGVLLGEGAGLEGAPPTANAISGGGRADTLNMFRKGEINVLVATSVAEEGLDFPVEYPFLSNPVAYVQSRGRARSKTASKFIIMLREDDNVELERYRQFLHGEPELQKQLSARLSHPTQADEEDDESDALYEMNLKDRERYVVPGTGATLNYDNAISLLGQLCALIPCDAFTQKQAPKFDVSVSPFPSHTVASVISSELPCVGYSCVLRLPGSLPLPSTHLSYTGPVKLTKKEAKRAVAFQAVKALQAFNVFNEFLLPTTVGSKSKALKGKKDVDGRGYVDVSMVLPMMNVNVRDPWFSGPNTQNLGLASGATDSSLWLHAIYINDQRVAGVVADISLPPCEFWTDQGSLVKMMSGRKLNLRQFSSHDIADILMGCMAQYTLKGIWYFLTGSPAAGSPSFYIVPLVHDAIEPDIDFTALRSFAAHPDGQNDWSDVTPDHYDRVLVMNRNQYGRVYLLRRIRHDLSPQSRPVDGSRESGPSTYYEFWKDSWTRKKWIADVPEDGPLIEATRLTRRLHAQYDVYRRAEYPPRHEVRDGALLPQGACVWIEFPPDVAQAFEIAPALAHRISDVYRVTSARLDIGLPAISPDLLVEAFTIPSANAPYNNQRLETLGDSVLKVPTNTTSSMDDLECLSTG
ncbi:hypothetical protein ONZ45_g12249 [Pleurotus djamor]|nr:hypothetical protein ONZ45_g12249 [Pleurotus djamor]